VTIKIFFCPSKLCILDSVKMHSAQVGSVCVRHPVSEAGSRGMEFGPMS
jgi:hypothetical protein